MKKTISLLLVLLLSLNNNIFALPSPKEGIFYFVNKRTGQNIFKLELNLGVNKFNVLHKNYFPLDLLNREKEVIRIRTFNEKNELIHTTSLKGNYVPSNYDFSSLENITFKKGYYLKIDIYSDNIFWRDISYDNGKEKSKLMGKNSFNLEEVRFYYNRGKFILYIEQPPEILGADDITIHQFEDFNPLNNVIAKSDIDGDITNKLMNWGYFNKNVPGKYTISYMVIDSKHKTTQKQRVITVVPSISITPNKRTSKPYIFRTNKYFKEHKERDNYFIFKLNKS